ncbi:hypothetical protein GWI33_017467 [Rhynchophorus ferrugineus]|uniref:Uncharacterized protein n=1 Tax=Rhynchophorus ferrugineus TaxID=354439 RepID=A0A834HZR2_RHYFE|nr:hypothetical protein GWI33_017467 [Rhynchophorus ferrugineus]
MEEQGGNLCCQIYNTSFSTTWNRYQHMSKFNDNKNREESDSCCVGSSQVITDVCPSRIVAKIVVTAKV